MVSEVKGNLALEVYWVRCCSRDSTDPRSTAHQPTFQSLLKYLARTRCDPNFLRFFTLPLPSKSRLAEKWTQEQEGKEEVEGRNVERPTKERE